MKKAILLVLLLVGNILVATAQQALPKLSPLTRLYLKRIKDYTGDDKHMHGYVYKTTTGGKLCVSGMVKVRNSKAAADMKKLGVSVGTKAGNIWTVQIPLGQV